jgi:negative regulator of sigma-B (phosphoserine phosphatase)
MTQGWPASLERGVAGRTHAGEARSGDVAVFAPMARGGLTAVIDGLGHGDPAADAAEAAAAIVRAHAEDPAQRLLERCHAALARTRGVVMTLVWFDVVGATVSWTGVGNVDARLVRATETRGLAAAPVLLGGVVGYTLPQVRRTTMPLGPGDAVALATDGVAADYAASLEPGVPAQELAERVLARHGKGSDDELVVVVRFVPPADVPPAA